MVKAGVSEHKVVAKACREINDLASLEWLPQLPNLDLIKALSADMEIELLETFGRVSEVEVLKVLLKNT